VQAIGHVQNEQDIITNRAELKRHYIVLSRRVSHTDVCRRVAKRRCC